MVKFGLCGPISDFCQHNLNFDEREVRDPLQKKQVFRGVKMKKSCPTFFLRLCDTYKKYTLQKKWVKTPIPALSSDQSNLQTPIWGCHHQLDDQNRNPNINNRDHLVGQLTMLTEANLGLMFTCWLNICIYRRLCGTGWN